MTSKTTTTKAETKPVKAAAKAASPAARKTSNAVADKRTDIATGATPAAQVPKPAKATKSRPVAVKPIKDAMPADAAPKGASAAGPAETNTADTRTAEKTKTAEIKAADTRTAEAKAAETKSVVAALLAARRKTAAAAAPSGAAPAADANVKHESGSVKGGVEVSDKKIKNAEVGNETVQATPVAAAPAPRPPVGALGGHPMAHGARRPGIAPAPVAKGGKPAPKGQGFKTNEFVVYPAHGVGEIIAIEQQEVAGYKLELFVISFAKDKMILKVPLPKIASVGMRKLAEPPVVKRALDTLTGRARVKRTMWSRRAQEYEAKINSGDLVSIAEVVRDLYRSDAQPEQSYSERQLYEAALDRMAREIAAVQDLTDTEALKVIDDQLQKGPRRGKVEDAETDEAEDGDEVETNVGEAA